MIRFRPHHFFCALGFQGKGYSQRFTANMAEIVDSRLRQSDDEQIEVVSGLDDICAPCPKRLGNACLTQAKINRLDAAHQDALSLTDGEVLTWGEAKARMAALPDGVHQRICAECSWLSYGMCEAAHTALKSS